MCRSALGTRAGTRAGTWAGTWAAVACGRQRARAASGQCARLDCDMQHRRRRDLRARQAPSRASSFCRASRCKLSPWRPVTPNGAPPKGRHRRRRHRCLPRSWSFSSCGRGSVLFPCGRLACPSLPHPYNAYNASRLDGCSCHARRRSLLASALTDLQSTYNAKHSRYCRWSPISRQRSARVT